jgi:hypothetical protein
LSSSGGERRILVGRRTGRPADRWVRTSSLSSSSTRSLYSKELKGEFLGFFLFMFDIQHCFICRPSDSTGSEAAGIELRTVATLTLTARRSKLDLIHLFTHVYLRVIELYWGGGAPPGGGGGGGGGFGWCWCFFFFFCSVLY